MLWIGDKAVVYQLKERESLQTTTNNEIKWFERKVLNKATRQIRDTIKYLKANPRIHLTNHRGHEVTLSPVQLNALHNLVVYLPNKHLPQQCRRLKHHLSREAGVIHLIPANDYKGIVRTLLTPAEFMDYLDYRTALLERWPKEAMKHPEPVLVGHYLHGDLEEIPNPEHLAYLHALQHKADTWDISGVIKNFADRVTTDGERTNYYPIVSALAELKRNELAEFKKRFMLSVKKAKANEFDVPYRMVIKGTGCGFIFIPLTRELIPRRQIGLQNLTKAHKYEQRLSKCVGVSFAPEGDGWYSLDWCYIEHPWQPDPDFDRLLSNNNPLREVRNSIMERYRFGR
jgi:hypothetical protein